MKLTSRGYICFLTFLLIISKAMGAGQSVNNSQQPEALVNRAYRLVDVPKNHDSVVVLLNGAEALVPSGSFTELKLRILNIRGLNEYNSGNYEEAVNNYYQLLDLAEQLHDTLYLAKGNHNLGMVYDELEDYEESIQYFRKSLEYSRTINDSAQMAKTFQNLAICYQNKKDLPMALRFIGEAQKIAASKNDTAMIIDLTNNLGTIAYDQKKLGESLDYYHRALDLYRKINDQQGIAYAYNNIGLVYFDQKDYVRSLEFFKRSLDLARSLQMNDFIADVYSNLTLYYKEIKDFEKAYTYYDKFNTVYDSLAGEKKSKMIRQIQAKYQLGKKTRELEELKSKNERQMTTIANAHAFQIYLALITILAFVLMAATIYLLVKEKRLASEIRSKSDELHQLNVAKDKFFSIIAHDLKNPFNVLVSYTSLLKTDLDMFSKEELRQIMNDLNQASENGFDLLQNLLLWTRSQTNRIHIFKSDFCVNEVVENVRGLVELNLQAKEQRLTIALPSDVRVHADKEMIATVLRNLIFNAIKFSPKGSEIELRGTFQSAELRIDVADSGVGMTRETMEKLFRIDKSTSMEGTEGETGTGLGLIICREFVEKNDGMLRVESELGKGSVFSFTLPLAKS